MDCCIESVMIVVLCCREGENVDAGTETNSNLYHELYYHFLGTDQSEDILCWRDPENPKYLFGASVTDDGKVISSPISWVYGLYWICICFLILMSI
jgi:hypothetical protein